MPSKALAHKKTILLTGAAGFIGSNVLEYLFRAHPTYRFIVLDALTYAGRLDHISDDIRASSRFTFHHGDVRDEKLVDMLVAESDAVVHFAAETHVEHSIYDNAAFFDTDILGTLSVANAVLCHEDTVDRFIHISTCEVYGSGMTEHMDESHLLNPQSPYAAAKAGADRLVFSYYKTYGIPAVILRPFNIFGPRQHVEKLIPRFTTSAILGKDLTVHGHGKAGRDFMYVDGVSDAVNRILHAPREKVIGEVFNIGDGESISNLEIAKAVVKEMQYPETKITFVADRPGQVSSFACDYRKAERVLGWRPPHAFSDGLKKTIAWYRENPESWKDQLDTNLAISGTLPSERRIRENMPQNGQSRIKVLFGINELTVGGAQRLTLNEIAGLNRSRFDSYLATLRPSAEQNFDESAQYLGDHWKKFSFAGLFDIVSWYQLYWYLKKEKFDVVVANLFFTGFLLRTAAIAAKVPVILSTELNVYNRSTSWILIERFLARYTHRIIANSKEVIDSASKQLGIPKEKFFLNYSTVNLEDMVPASEKERAAARAQYNVPSGNLVIVTAGRLVEQKGQQYLIDAFAALPDSLRAHTCLFIFGEGARRAELEANIKEQGLEQSVFLPGAAPIQNIMALADIFALPSLWEGMPVVLLEAMASGLPIVATRVSGANEVIENSETGLLVPAKDSKALCEALETMLRDSTLRARLGKSARAASSAYSLEKHLEELTKTIDEAIGERHGPRVS